MPHNSACGGSLPKVLAGEPYRLYVALLSTRAPARPPARGVSAAWATAVGGG